jgi:hypothetical protein
MKKVFVFSMMLFFVSFVPSFLYAIPYGFQNVTNNNATNAAAGEAQLSLNVTGLNNTISFQFINSGPVPCVITQIYFDFPTAGGYSLNFSSFATAAGNTVVYQTGGTPHNLPGGQPISFVADFVASPDNPQPTYGVGTGENLFINFSLLNGIFNNVISDLDSGALRVGIHVQSFANGGSESFINDPQAAPVPEPTTMLLLGTGLLGLAGFRKKMKK